MIKVEYTYGATPYDFLDIFEIEDIPSSFVLLVKSSPTVGNLYTRSSVLDQLLKTDYNYAIMSDLTTKQRWTYEGNHHIRVLDTKLFVINNILDAKNIFALAKSCRANVSFYEKLFQIKLAPYDNVMLTIANHLYGATSGFHEFPINSIEHQHPLFTATKAFNNSASAIMNYNGVTAIE